MNIFLIFLKRILFLCCVCISFVSYSHDNIKSDLVFGGFIQYDNVYWIGDNGDDFVSGLFLKDVSIHISGKYNDELNCFIKFDLSNYKLKNSLSEAYIKYSYGIFNFKLGQFIPHFSLEEAILVNNKVFIENALLKCNLEENFLGFSFNFNLNNYNIFASIITPEISYNNRIKNNNYSLSFRGFTKLFEKKNLQVHAGVNYSVFNRGEDDDLSLKTSAFRDIPSFSSPYTLLFSHPSCLPKYYLFGFEFVSIYKILSIQSELRFTNAIWKDFDSEIYKSFYFQISCFLTGEKRKYDFFSGSVINSCPNSQFGSFEIAFRYNHVNITNEGPLLRGVSQSDGKKNSYNFGVNWLVNSNIKFQINYSHENFSYRIFKDRAISAIGLRTQFEF